MAQNWLHCNECFIQPEKTGIRFHLTNCSHIFCEKCVDACTKERCKMCKAQCTTLPLSGKVPRQVEDMFADPLETLKKNLKSFSQGYEFHRSQQKRLIRNLQNKNKFYHAQMAEAKKFLNQAKLMEKEFKKLKKENEYFKTLINKDGGQRLSSRNKSRISPNRISSDRISPNRISSNRISPNGLHRVMTPSNPPPYQSQQSISRTLGSQYQQQHANGFNISSSRLLMRTPPIGGKMGSRVCDFNPTPDRRGMNYNTPDSGFSDSPIDGRDSPLTIPRPIHFTSQD